MSYRPPEQALEEPCRDLVNDFDHFIKIANRRLASQEWSAEHENELVDLITRMTKLKLDLLRLSRRTW
jgi:hypothetical protein